MKPRLAAILSIAGVLFAGSAAALVNTKVLETDGGATNASPAPASAPAQPLPASVPLPSGTTPPATAPGTPASTVPATTVTVAAPPSAPVETTVAQPPVTNPAEQATGVYQVGDGGTVTLSTAGDVLTIVSVDPAPGWYVKEAEHEDAHNIEVRLRSDDREVRFEANLLFGVVGTSLRTDDDD